MFGFDVITQKPLQLVGEIFYVGNFYLYSICFCHQILLWSMLDSQYWLKPQKSNLPPYAGAIETESVTPTYTLNTKNHNKLPNT